MRLQIFANALPLRPTSLATALKGSFQTRRYSSLRVSAIDVLKDI
jgi:hypothetical protein